MSQNADDHNALETDQVIDGMPFSVAVVDSADIIVEANRIFAAATGHAIGRLVGHPLPLDRVLPEDQWRVGHVLAEARAHGRASTSVRYRPPGQSSMRHANVQARQLVRPAGHVLLMVRDRTALDARRTSHTHVERDIERTLLQSEALYQTFLEQSPLGIVHVDAGGTVTFENYQFRQIVGENPEDAWIGRSLQKMSDLDYALTPQLDSMLGDGIPFSNKLVQYKRSDEESLSLVVHGSPIRHPDGGILGGVLMILDQTRQYAQRRELELRDRFRFAENVMRTVALDQPTEDAFLDSIADILGAATDARRLFVLTYDPAESGCRCRASWSSSASDDAKPDVVDVEPASVLSRIAVEKRGRLVDASIEDAAVRQLLTDENANGVWTPFYQSDELAGFVVFELDDDAVVPIQDLLTNLNQLVRVFETLWLAVQVSNRYRLAVDCIEDGLFNYVLTEDGRRRYTFVTPQFKGLVGVEPDQILAPGASSAWFERGLDPDSRTKVAEYSERLRSGNSARVLFRFRTADGVRRWLREDGTPHVTADGLVTVSGIIVDVTDQQLAQEVLRQAKVSAEQEAQRKTAFIATMSHEMRTPLGTVNGFAGMLKQELEDLGSAHAIRPELVEFAESIEERSGELLRLVDDLIDLSNVESGLLSVATIPVSVAEVVARCVSAASAAAEEKSLSLGQKVEPGLFVSADPVRIKKVIDKLVENAIKFTAEGGVTIRAFSSGPDAVIEIADSGVGIALEKQQEVFEPFTQEDDRLNRAYEGPGLGLTVVDRFVSAMGGSVQLESTPGIGTTVRLVLQRTSPGL